MSMSGIIVKYGRVCVYVDEWVSICLMHKREICARETEKESE